MKESVMIISKRSKVYWHTDTGIRIRILMLSLLNDDFKRESLTLNSSALKFVFKFAA